MASQSAPLQASRPHRRCGTPALDPSPQRRRGGEGGRVSTAQAQRGLDDVRVISRMVYKAVHFEKPLAMQTQIISRIIERSLRTVRATPTLTGFAIGVLLAAALPLGGP